MNPIYIILIILIVVVAVYYFRNQGPSVMMFSKISDGLSQIQKSAYGTIIPNSDSQSMANFDESKMKAQTVTLENTIRFVYTVEQNEYGFLHTISSQLLKRKNKKYQVQCMLVAMMTLNTQLKDASIEEGEVNFDIDESELGTQYIGMQLSEKQHEQLLGATENG
jgi:hypothetical protein